MGGLLLIIGLAVLAFGAMQHFKGKRILAAPFKKTGDIAKNPVSEDPKGAMSTEGKVLAPAQQLLSPCTKQPCLAYEVKVERLYEKTETTQDGTRTVKGSETLETFKGGSIFGLDDGSGAVMVDVTKGADFDNMKEGFKKELNGHSGSSNIMFGEMRFDVPAIGSDRGWTIGFKATEKFVPVEGNLFVLGKLDGGKLTKPGWRSMMTSAKGREGLLGSIQKKKKFSFIGGGVAAVLAIPLMIWGPQPDPNAVSAYCESTLTDARQRCGDTVSSEDGEHYTWTVTKPGEYEVSVFAPNKKISLIPQLIIKDADGKELANESGPMAGTVTAKLDVKAGTYDLVVAPADHYMVKGGFSFDMEIKSLSAPVAPVAKADGEENAADEGAANAAAYTDEDLASRVEDLNEMCGDTFCEGQFDYQFKKLACADATHCTLSFTAKNQDKKNSKPMDVELEVAGFKALRQDLEKDFVYEGSFDEAVSNALMKWEENPVASKKVAAPKAEKKPVKKAEVAPKQPKKAAAPVAPKPVKKTEVAPKQPKATIAAVAKPAPAPVVQAPATTAKRSSKNLED
ncbi:MAG: GIDE domain-containing protein [Myxococcaceae bacterium]